MNLTNSQEEYLKAIYILNSTKNEIKVTQIANKLNKSKASVNSAINILKNEGLIDYEPYGQIKLTDIGKKEATKIIEANDIVKLFLTELIGVNNDNASIEAEKIKTILSDDSLNKLARYTYKELGLNPNCSYDINNESCLRCGLKNKIEKNKR